jgi:hypothetical protein
MDFPIVNIHDFPIRNIEKYYEKFFLSAMQLRLYRLIYDA